VSEANWLSRAKPSDLLTMYTRKARQTKAAPRLLRLCACACAWQLEPWLRPQDAVCRTAVAAAEAFADGVGDPAALARLADEVFPLGPGMYSRFPPRIMPVRTAFRETLNPDPSTAAAGAVTCAEIATADGADSRARVVVTGEVGPSRITPVLAGLVRDVLGNPFRPPVPLAPAWVTATVAGLASTIYATGAFDRLPILADALEDAGCTDKALLAHCRGPGPHARGCWAVDLVRGMSRA
jgi:hypothetical protein